jgi:prepilin-type N-terminal cleavage/methylation domain-containing protein
MNKKNGFTLIELMVAITIGILMVGLGSVSLNNFNERQKVETVRQELLSNLRLARNYAVTNQLGVGGDRIAVVIDSSGIMTIESRDANDTDAVTFFSKDITPNGVSISAPVIRFSVTDGRSIGGAVTVSVIGVETKYIKIDDSGLIYGE